MASTTSNLGLTKPAGTDKALVSVINTNSDILDRSAGGLMDALAIVAQGNTHGAISAGQYVYVRGHNTLAEGLYTANSAIAANATLTTSNLTADASGGLNALNSNLNSLSQLSKADISDLDNAVTPSSYGGLKLYVYQSSASNKPTGSGGIVMTIGYSDTYYTQIAIANSSSGTVMYARNHGSSGFTAWKQFTLS